MKKKSWWLWLIWKSFSIITFNHFSFLFFFFFLFLFSFFFLNYEVSLFSTPSKRLLSFFLSQRLQNISVIECWLDQKKKKPVVSGTFARTGQSILGMQWYLVSSIGWVAPSLDIRSLATKNLSCMVKILVGINRLITQEQFHDFCQARDAQKKYQHKNNHDKFPAMYLYCKF